MTGLSLPLLKIALPIGIRPFILKRMFEVSELEYDVEYQLAAIEDDNLELEDLY